MGWSPSGDTSADYKYAIIKISEKEGKMNISIICIVQYVLKSICYFVLVLISWWYSDKRISKFHRKEGYAIIVVLSVKQIQRFGMGRCIRFMHIIRRKKIWTGRLELKIVKKIWIKNGYYKFTIIISYYLMSAISYFLLYKSHLNYFFSPASYLYISADYTASTVARRERNRGSENMHEKGW